MDGELSRQKERLKGKKGENNEEKRMVSEDRGEIPGAGKSHT